MALTLKMFKFNLLIWIWIQETEFFGGILFCHYETESFPLISLQMHKKIKKKKIKKLREIIYSLKNPKPINRVCLFSLCLCGFYLAWQLHKTRLEVLSSLRTDLSITILKDLSGK